MFTPVSLASWLRVWPHGSLGRFQQVATEYEQIKSAGIDPQVQELADHHGLGGQIVSKLCPNGNVDSSSYSSLTSAILGFHMCDS